MTWSHPFLDIFLSYVPVEISSALDVGCGRGVVGALLRIYREPKRVVGVDNFDPYLRFCEKLGVYDSLLKQDLNITPLPFDADEFQLSVALEVIEHLPKPRGIALLDELERVSRIVMVSTPDRFFAQSAYDANPHQKHLSRWRREDFRGRGYSVQRLGEFLVFGRKMKYLSYFLGQVLSSPQLSTTIFATYRKP